MSLSRRAAELRLMARARSIYRKYSGFTMIHFPEYMANLLLAAKARELPGCVVECGVWRGGMSAGMAEVLGPDRDYYLFDSFQGLPDAKEIDGEEAIRYQRDKDSSAYYDNCTAEIGFAKKAMSLSPAKRVTYKPGWFSETLPGFAPPEGIAVLRLDADWYESTKQCLDALYAQVVPGGVILIDDYYTWEGCTKAVHDYLSEAKVPDRIRQSRIGGVCYIVRGA